MMLVSGSNAAMENADSSAPQAVPISALLQNAQDMLVGQQQEEAALRAASFASASALQEAQVSIHMLRHSTPPAL